MLFFSGFCLDKEQELFYEFLSKSSYEVAGFSLGAIKAYEYSLNTKKRVDTLTLISPAFFLDKDEKFKRVQLLHFKKNSDKYIENFLKNASYPCKNHLTKYLKKGSYEELELLLNYKWDKILDKNIDIRVILGEDDKIIDAKEAFDFFKKFARVYLYKGRGHTLCKL